MKKIIALLLWAVMSFTSAQTNTYNILTQPTAPLSYTFATLPSASTYNGQQVFVSDVGTGGSYWISNGTQWSLVGGTSNLFQSNIPMGLPSSGTVASNGTLTLTTALDQTYPNIYFYLPAGWYTGASAGMYYGTCSSTTACTMYQNQYVSGIPTIPASPTPVTTGAGAYTQTTGSYLNVLSYNLPANVMGLTGKITSQILTTNNNSAGLKAIYPASPLIMASVQTTTAIGTQILMSSQNAGVVNRQIYASQNLPNVTVALTVGSTNTSSQITIQPQVYLATSTDWIILQSYQLILSR